MTERHDPTGAAAGSAAGEHGRPVMLGDLGIDTSSAEFRRGYEEGHRRAEIGRFFRGLRCGWNLNQSDLASAMATTQPHIARIERGGSCPQLDTFERLANALDCGLIVAIVAADEIEHALEGIDDRGGRALVYRPGSISLELRDRPGALP